MKIKILEYEAHKGNKVRVQSHNLRKGKYKVNPNFEFHRKVANGGTMIMFGILWKKEYEIEVKL